MVEKFERASSEFEKEEAKKVRVDFILVFGALG